VCSICGLNHEARDFIRATLLYLLDRFERSSDYLEFLRENNYVDREHYNEYCKFIERNLGKRISERLVAETQFIRAETNEEQRVAEKPDYKEPIMEGRSPVSKRTAKQIVAEKWFENRMGLTKRMAERILSNRPEISKEQLKNLADGHRSKTHSRSYLDAIYSIAKDLGVSLSDDLEVDYDKRKKSEAYENRVREKTLERRTKRRAKSRQTSN